ncbi:UBX domain-containing protein 10 [Apus apus]|uniref:UBX domain-containing protein 10 n=1 Tax=Apus apus TaxID=8895 RepID=UPI0021F83B08|nr:UBX domain-containing protein 10 [Apus apus]
MATAALLTLAHGSFPPGTAAPSWGPDTTTMHVTRPKSAKGRTRPSCSHLQSVAACPCQVPPSPPPAPLQELGSSRRSSSTKPPFPSSQVSPEEIPELLQHVPLRTSSSLTRYKVLPSIGKQGTGSRAVEALAEQANWLRLSREQEDVPKIPTLLGEQGSTSVLSESDVPSEEGSCAQCPLEKQRRKMRQESPWMSTLSLEEPPKEKPCVLLAVRAPSGQRFEHHFKPTDSLQTVLAMAEQKMSAQYQGCSIETMEVPRRSFSDLTRSLQECGILHKSLLCIRQEQHNTDL